VNDRGITDLEISTNQSDPTVLFNIDAT